jgi:alpha-L-fucosidase 2
LVARFVQPNTMYYEAGPVIETPLSGAQSLHDMLCQSWGGVIRIFPAVPAAWADVTLDDFRTQGAFLVSAVRRAGVTTFVKVHSLAGEPCRVRTGIAGPLTVRALHGRDPKWRTLPNGDVEIDLPRGAEAVIHRRGTKPDLTIAPVKVTAPAPRWGLPPLPPAGPIVTVDLGAAFNNDGTSNEFSMTDGNFDGTGRTYPAAQLPQTGHLTADGIEFVFFNGAEGTLNNVVAAGQTIALPSGRYNTLHLIGAADTGDASIPVTLTYADGSAASVPLELTAWLSDPNHNESVALRTNLVHTPTGALNLQAALFHQKLAADPTRDLVSLTLPVPAGPRPHIFALALEHPTT